MAIAGGNSVAPAAKCAEDTVIAPIDTSELLTAEDSLDLFPAYELYGQWDTAIIHPYHYDIKNLKDTVTIPLIDQFNCGYVHPFKGHISSDFGSRKGRPHYGVDIDLETGDTVVCAFSGMVRIARKNKSYGNVVIIRHSNGLETYYAHLSKINVESGQLVEPGQFIGLGGNTGHSFGSHLHFEVRYKGCPINPNELIAFDKMKLKADSYKLTPKSFEFVVKAKQAKYCTIKKGDTLSRIAKRYHTSTKALCKLNGIKTSSVLRTGRKLRYS